jgi:hypothetical protein
MFLLFGFRDDAYEIAMIARLCTSLYLGVGDVFQVHIPPVSQQSTVRIFSVYTSHLLRSSATDMI